MSKATVRIFWWLGLVIVPLAIGVLNYPFVAALVALIVFYLVGRIIVPRRSENPVANWIVGLLVVLVPGSIAYGFGMLVSRLVS